MDNMEWVTDRLSFWRNVLLLHEWKINVSLSDAPSDSDKVRASCVATADIRHAEIVFRNDIEDSPEWEKTIVHELLHVRFAELQDFVEFDLIGELSPSAQSLANDVWRRRLEPVIDMIAGSFCGRM